MKLTKKLNVLWTMVVCTGAVASVFGALLIPTAGRCDTPVSMAPPLWTPQGNQDADSNSVFNWADVPQNQSVTINSAVFDQGGYQLYDTAGETIVVPFTNNNLYVMEFAKSSNGSMYFINDGDEPILYVPRGGYLENATVPGARWYPFTAKFHPSTPVFLGIAPSWNAFIGMGWYSDMYCHGGYYGSAPFGTGVFVAVPGFSFMIGSTSFNDWHTYHGYWKQYGAPYHVGYRDKTVYSHSGGSFWNGGRPGTVGGSHPGNRSFQGGGPVTSHDSSGPTFSGGSTNNSGGRTYGGGSTNNSGGRTYGGGSTNNSGGRTYGGGSNNDSGGRTYSGGSTNNSGGRTFSGGTHNSGSGANTYHGNASPSTPQGGALSSRSGNSGAHGGFSGGSQPGRNRGPNNGGSSSGGGGNGNH